jgi:hypothetical protein
MNSNEIIYSTKIRNARQIQKFLARKKIWNRYQKSKKNYGSHPLLKKKSSFSFGEEKLVASWLQHLM